MGITTKFADLIASPVSEKIFLVEIRLAEEITGWTLTGGQAKTYEVAYLNETITLADASTEIIRKEIVGVQLDGSPLTAKILIAQVEATAGSYWHDTVNSKLYIHPLDDGTPVHHTIIGFFWLYLGTKGVILGNVEWEEETEWEDGVEWGIDYPVQYYEPYIADRGIPQISQRIQDICWGISQISIGGVTLLNSRGFFDQISNKFYWTNKKIRILMGGDLLPYSEYHPIFTGKINKKTFTQRDLTLDIRSVSFDLLRQIPINHFWKSNFPNLDPSAEGKTIPYAWGDYDSYQAPIVTCINTAYTTNTYQFKICDTSFHAIKDIIQVYVDYGDGFGWVAITHANEDLAAATFTITSASFVLGTSRVKVAFQGYHSGGIVIEGAPEIVEDILLNVCDYEVGNLDAPSFTASKADSDCVLNVFLDSEISALSVIEKICRSDFASFDENGEGELRYRTTVPTYTGSIPTLTSEDILDSSIPVVNDDPEQLYYKIRVGYSYLGDQQNYLYLESEYLETKYRYEKSEILTLETYLRSSIDADSLAGRLLWLLRDISPLFDISIKVSQIEKNIGDRIKITLERAPYSTVGGYNERIFGIIGKELSCFPVIQILNLYDMMGFGDYVGTWMDDVAPDWITATPAERLVSGFWTDDDGYADPPNAISLNKSLWW